jgi:ABC-type glycerol-3-phosphate transport system substrate-binding protein
MKEFEICYWGLLGHLIDKNITLYHQKHPEIVVHADGTGTDYLEFLEEKFLQNRPPDFFQTFNEPNARFLRKGWVGVLEDYIPEAAFYKNEISNEQYRKSILTPDGRVQAMIYYGAHSAFVYNSLHLQSAGFDEPPTQWDEVIEQAKKVKEKGLAKAPILLDIGGPGYLEAIYTLMLGMNPPQRSYLFDEDLNPVFDDVRSPFFVMLRWVADAANKHKVLLKESTQYGISEAAVAMGQLKHTFSWLPRYMVPVIDFVSMSRNVSQALNPGYGYTSCWTRLYSPTKRALESNSKRLEELWKLMQYFGGRTDSNLEPDLKNGEYRVLKSQVVEAGVPSPPDTLWKDNEVLEQMGRWGPLDILLEQDKKVYNAQCDPWPAPWLQEWVNEYGKAPLKTFVHAVVERGADNAELLAGLRKIASDWKRLKTKYQT